MIHLPERYGGKPDDFPRVAVTGRRQGAKQHSSLSASALYSAPHLTLNQPIGICLVMTSFSQGHHELKTILLSPSSLESTWHTVCTCDRYYCLPTWQDPEWSRRQASEQVCEGLQIGLLNWDPLWTGGCAIPWAWVASSISSFCLRIPRPAAPMLMKYCKSLTCETKDPSFIPLPLRGILSQQ